MIHLVYITASSGDEASKIAHHIVENRLAACASILDGAKSVYWWKGQLETASETVIIVKTTSNLIEKLVAAVKAIHSYEVPCVVSVPIENGNADFLKWIKAETVGPAEEKKSR